VDERRVLLSLSLAVRMIVSEVLFDFFEVVLGEATGFNCADLMSFPVAVSNVQVKISVNKLFAALVFDVLFEPDYACAVLFFLLFCLAIKQDIEPQFACNLRV
jgi:hypothetical protein